MGQPLSDLRTVWQELGNFFAVEVGRIIALNEMRSISTAMALLIISACPSPRRLSKVEVNRYGIAYLKVLIAPERILYWNQIAAIFRKERS